MNIRTRITVIFFLIVMVIVSGISLSIFYFSSDHRKEDFYNRLESRATNAAKLLIQFEEVNAVLLQRMERENPASLPKQQIVIYNYKDEILYQSELQTVIPVDSALLSRIRLEGEVRFQHNEFEVLGFLFADKFERFTVVAAATDINGLDALGNLRNILLTTFFLSLLIVSALGWFFAGQIVKPISDVVGEVDAITEKNLGLRLAEGNRHDELGKLAMTFNKMISRLQNAFVSQKNFIANASHEIKTPITMITGEIEVALLQKRTAEYYERILHSVLRGAKRMNKLSTQLLLLAQASSEDFESQFKLVRIDDIVWTTKEALTKANPTFRINIEFDNTINDDVFVINGDDGLLSVVFHNLMENGCKYSTDNTVHISLKADEKYLHTTFVNNGPGINTEDLPKIFEPFYRGKADKKTDGFGIGLPLANKVVNLHGGTLSVHSLPNHHTTFVLRLPRTDLG